MSDATSFCQRRHFHSSNETRKCRRADRLLFANHWDAVLLEPRDLNSVSMVRVHSFCPRFEPEFDKSADGFRT